MDSWALSILPVFWFDTSPYLDGTSFLATWVRSDLGASYAG